MYIHVPQNLVIKCLIIAVNEKQQVENPFDWSQVYIIQEKQNHIFAFDWSQLYTIQEKQNLHSVYMLTCVGKVDVVQVQFILLFLREVFIIPRWGTSNNRFCATNFIFSLYVGFQVFSHEQLKWLPSFWIGEPK